jgi:sterol desaturase/sphingolipid hydroxylase (fatty acid hydroxylase superfamily)
MKSICLVSFNLLVTFPLSALGALYSQNWEVEFSFEIEKFPDSFTLLLSICFFMICEDFGCHFTHRILHWRVIYPYIHKIHHTYSNSIGLTAEYTHPLDYLFACTLPGALGALILGKDCHFFTTMVWGFVILGETIDNHSGYEFSWSPYRLIPFTTSARYHDFSSLP